MLIWALLHVYKGHIHTSQLNRPGTARRGASCSHTAALSSFSTTCFSLCTANSPRPTLIPEHTHKLLDTTSSVLGPSQPSLPGPLSGSCSAAQPVHLILLGRSQAGGSRVQRWSLGEMFSERHCKGSQPKLVTVFRALGCSFFRCGFWSWGKMQLPARHHLPPSSPFLLIQHSRPCHKSTYIIMAGGSDPVPKRRIMPR